MSPRMPRPPRDGRGRPRYDADDFEDANLAAAIRTLADELGRGAYAEDVYAEAVRRRLFSVPQLGRFGRRSAVEYINRCFRAYSAQTGGPYRIAVPGSQGRQLWITEVLATQQESRESYIALCKGALGDVGELGRRWEHHVRRYGPDDFPPRPQIELGI